MNPWVYTTQKGIGEIKNNPQVYTTQEGIREIIDFVCQDAEQNIMEFCSKRFSWLVS